MNEQNLQNYQGEIELRELFLALWKHKLSILSFAVLGAILAGILSVFFLDPVYITSMKVDLNIPETYNTRYGEYKMTVSSDRQYMELITNNDVIAETIKDMEYDSSEVNLNDLKKRITIGRTTSTVQQKIHDITVSAPDPVEAQKLAKVLYNNYLDYLFFTTNERALNHYNNMFSSNIKSCQNIIDSTKVILKKNKELLANTPQTINQSNLINTEKNVVIENIINPAYTKIEEAIIENQQLIYSTEESIKKYEKYLNEIDTEKNVLNEYTETGNIQRDGTGLINIANTNIILVSSPEIPIEKTSPNTILNIAMGLIIAVVVGAVFLLIKEFWLKKV